MSLSSDIIKKGRITIYSDTPEQTERDVLEYNKLMDDCRFRKKLLKELELGYTAINPLVVFVIVACTADVMFEKSAPVLMILLVFAAAYVIFGLFMKKYIVSTAAASLLLICHPIFAVVFVTDIILTVMYVTRVSQLKTQPGYPAFVDIAVTYDRHPAPKADQ